MAVDKNHFKELVRNIQTLTFRTWLLGAVLSAASIERSLNLLKHDIDRAVKLRRFVIRD